MNRQDFKKQVLSNLGSNYLNKMLSITLALFIVPFLAHKMGKETYGIVLLAESTILFFEIVTISLKAAMTRFATYSFSQGKKAEFIEYLSSGRFLLFVCAAFVFVAGSIISVFFPYAIKIGPEYFQETRILFFLITVGFSISIPNIVFASTILAKQRPDLINFIMSAVVLFKAVLIFTIYSIFPLHSTLPYAWIYLATSLVQNAMVYFLYLKLMPGLRIPLLNFNKNKIREILSFGAHSSISRLSEILYDNTAMIIIGFVWGPASVAIYSISLKFAMTAKRIFLEASWTLIPTFVDFVAKKELKKMEHLYITYTKVMTIINTPICLALVLMAKPLITFWVGKDFIQAAYLLPIHIIPLFMAIPFSVCGCLTYAYNKVKIPGFLSLAAAILNVFLGLLFGIVFSWGLYGIAAGAALTSTVYLAAFFPYYACRISGLPLKKYIVRSFLKPFVLACAVMGAAFAGFHAAQIRLNISTNTFFVLAGLFAIYAIIAFRVILNGFERKHLREASSLLLPWRWKPSLGNGT